MSFHDFFIFIARIARRCEHYLAVAYSGAEVAESRYIALIAAGLFVTGILAIAYEAIHAD